MTPANQHLWWYVARAGGLVAWWAATTDVLFGLALSGRLIRRKGVPAWLLSMHRFLGALTVSFTGVHIAGLVADSYVHFGWQDVLVPFASRWHPLAVAFGIAAMYTLVTVEVTSLLMKRLPRRVWRAIHGAGFVVFAAGTVHALTAGTERTNTAVQLSALGAAMAFTFLAVYRQLAPRHRPVGATS